MTSRTNLDAHGVVPLASQPDANRGLIVDLTKLTKGATVPVAGPYVQSGEPADYTMYIARRWRWDGSPTKTLSSVNVTFDYGSGAVMETMFSLPQIPARGIAYHVCAQSFRARFAVLLPPGGAMPQDQLLCWVAHGRPWKNEAVQQVTFAAPTTRYDVPNFVTSMRVASLTGDTGSAMAARLAFYNEQGLAVGEQDLVSADGPWSFDFIVPPRAVQFSLSYVSGAQAAALIRWEMFA